MRTTRTFYYRCCLVLDLRALLGLLDDHGRHFLEEVLGFLGVTHDGPDEPEQFRAGIEQLSEDRIRHASVNRCHGDVVCDIQSEKNPRGIPLSAPE